MPPLATKSDEKMAKFKSVGLRHGANPMRKSKSKRFFALDLQKKYVSKIISCKLKLSLSFCRRDYRLQMASSSSSSSSSSSARFAGGVVLQVDSDGVARRAGEKEYNSRMMR